MKPVREGACESREDDPGPVAPRLCNETGRQLWAAVQFVTLVVVSLRGNLRWAVMFLELTSFCFLEGSKGASHPDGSMLAMGKVWVGQEMKRSPSDAW